MGYFKVQITMHKYSNILQISLNRFTFASFSQTGTDIFAENDKTTPLQDLLHHHLSVWAVTLRNNSESSKFWRATHFVLPDPGFFRRNMLRKLLLPH